MAQSKKSVVASAIQDLANEHDSNWVIVSSRHDTDLESWQRFVVATLQPLKRDRACELVEKLPFDDDLKQKFLDELRTDLFDKHESFVSNPLLLSIMLLTYGQGAHIPDKLSIFYSKAYEALFERHDALKGGFQRQRLTSLDIQEFARVFAAFCLQTYDKTEYQFSKTSALRYLENCKKIANLNYSASDYLEDALQAVCLLVEDGLSLVFAHRSFQEYFTARFISEANPNVQSSLIKKYREHVGPENVIGLLYEIRPEVVGRYYILPGMDQLVERIGVKKNVRITHYTRYLKLAYRDFVIGEEHIWAFRGTHNWLAQLTYFVVSRCGHLVGWSGFKNTEETIRFMVKKYGRVKVVTADLSYRDNFVKDLGEGNVFQSMETLRLAMRIREAIVEKHRITEASLEEILGEEPGEVGGAKEAK